MRPATDSEKATANLFIKIRPSQMKLLDRAAVASFQSRSAFVLAAATQAARQILADPNVVGGSR